MRKLLAVLLFAVSFGAVASPVVYQNGGASQAGIGYDGVTGNPDADTFTINASNGTFFGYNLGNTTGFNLATYSFFSDLNRGSDIVTGGTLPFTFNAFVLDPFHSLSALITLPFEVSISARDTLTVSDYDQNIFANGQNYDLHVNGFSVLGTDGRGTVNGTITATLQAVPEPEAMTLLFIGMGALLAVGRRAKRKTA